jgi:hypothetical protein
MQKKIVYGNIRRRIIDLVTEHVIVEHKEIELNSKNITSIKSLMKED